ncbi:hypothetical protein [Paraburkholderia graminis]|uniref:hypothetical protein n=1 Tax=Paraburkholderia graminis TaxID=60548 RepID=UPI0027D90EA5|nr:hypothetical protein [Paraburkholderia graminis]
MPSISASWIGAPAGLGAVSAATAQVADIAEIAAIATDIATDTAAVLLCQFAIVRIRLIRQSADHRARAME